MTSRPPTLVTVFLFVGFRKLSAVVARMNHGLLWRDYVCEFDTLMRLVDFFLEGGGAGRRPRTF